MAHRVSKSVEVLDLSNRDLQFAKNQSRIVLEYHNMLRGNETIINMDGFYRSRHGSWDIIRWG